MLKSHPARPLTLLLIGFNLLLSLAMADTPATATLQSQFKTPPVSARPGAFWNWLNGNTDRNRIKYDLQQMKDKGMSGAEIWDVAAIRNGDQIPAGPEFLGKESAEIIRFALTEARKLGLRMGMITSSGWNAGGTWVTPDWATKCLVTTSTLTTGPATYASKLPFPELPENCPTDTAGNPVFALNIAVLAVPENPGKTIADIDKVIDLTDRLTDDGTLNWDVPAGEWRIFRFVCTNTGQYLIVPSPKSKGLMIDFLDPDATRRHMQHIMDSLGITPANAAESGLSYMEVDSMELDKGIPWTDKFADWFLKDRGYDLRRWMPVLAGWTIKDKDTSDRFHYDFRHSLSDLLIHSHYETGTSFLHQYGMEFVGEAGGPGPPVWDTCPVDALKALGNLDIPRGEFWIQHRNIFLIKEIASAAHTYGKSLVDAESFTTWRRWEDSPFVLKQSADRAFTEGLNHITIHGFAHSPDKAGLPGWCYHAGIDINPNTTWWPYARPFMDYLARCSFMLRQGRPVGDVLWYYGDQAPNFFPSFQNVPEKPRLPGLGRGYDYDVVNTDVILHRLKVENGRFVLPEGTSYAVLAFPEDAAVTLEVLQKLESFVKQGGIIVGQPPRLSPGLFDFETRTRELRDLADQLWGDQPSTGPHTYGSGKVYTSTTLDQVLAAEGVSPDFTPEISDPKSVDYIHRATDAEDIYFLCNSSTGPLQLTARFRVTGKSAQVWDPSTGDSQPVAATASGPADTTVDIALEPGGTRFVVFTTATASAPIPAAPAESVHSLAFTSPWRLTFPAGSGAPTSATVTALKSWTDFTRKGIRYFSGTATYTNQFTVEKDQLTSDSRIYLDLGQVFDVAEVTLNGKPSGVSWKPPYRADITDTVRPGPNDLSVAVTNLWHNRRIGDANTTASRQITRTNLPLPDKKAAPLPSGLIGPVTLIESR